VTPSSTRSEPGATAARKARVALSGSRPGDRVLDVGCNGGDLPMLRYIQAVR
jgi:ubiquinone/menaquinone biosynthesis C-methylase UbiE